MVFEVSLLLLLVVGIMALSVKLYEWSQDVLYGPYLRPDDQFGPK